jgi:hypothetical protein
MCTSLTPLHDILHAKQQQQQEVEQEHRQQQQQQQQQQGADTVTYVVYDTRAGMGCLHSHYMLLVEACARHLEMSPDALHTEVAAIDQAIAYPVSSYCSICIRIPQVLLCKFVHHTSI